MNVDLSRNEAQALAYASQLVREWFEEAALELGLSHNSSLPLAHAKLIGALEREELLTL